MNALIRAFVFACVFALAVGLAHADPQGVSFTYQGQLRNSGVVVNGNHDHTFALYDAQTSGSQIGSTVTANNWPIIDGLFTIDLTFPGAFAGNQRWLAVTVDGTPLAPRQPVSATPVAQYALTGNPGPQGVQGPIGLSALSATAAEPAGANCATGGTRVDFGVDANSNGVLDAVEDNAALRRYVCNGSQGPQGIQGASGAPGGTGAPGANGLNALSATTAEAPGANCATGGARVDFGLDANSNGVLDAGEVNAALRRYVCNGAQGPQGVQGATGATGAAGPQGPAGALGLFGDGSAGVLSISTNTDWSAAFPGANLQFTSAMA